MLPKWRFSIFLQRHRTPSFYRYRCRKKRKHSAPLLLIPFNRSRLYRHIRDPVFTAFIMLNPAVKYKSGRNTVYPAARWKRMSTSLLSGKRDKIIRFCMPHIPNPTIFFLLIMLLLKRCAGRLSDMKRIHIIRRGVSTLF